MNPQIASAGVTALGGLASGFLGMFGSNSAGKAQLQATRETNQMNYKIWQEQRQAALAQWNRENEYNTPAMQRQRLEEAGYNPALYSGDGNTAGSMSVPDAPTMQMASSEAFQSPLTALGQGIINGAQAFSQIALANQENARANVLLPFNIDALKGSNARQWLDVEHLRKMYPALYHIQELSNTLFEKTMDNQIKYSQLQNDEISARIAGIHLSNATQSILNEWLPAEKQQSFMIGCQQLFNLYKSGILTDKQIQTEIQKRLGIELDNSGKVIDNRIKRETADSIIDALNTANWIEAGMNRMTLEDNFIYDENSKRWKFIKSTGNNEFRNIVSEYKMSGGRFSPTYYNADNKVQESYRDRARRQDARYSATGILPWMTNYVLDMFYPSQYGR